MAQRGFRLLDRDQHIVNLDPIAVSQKLRDRVAEQLVDRRLDITMKQTIRHGHPRNSIAREDAPQGMTSRRQTLGKVVAFS